MLYIQYCLDNSHVTFSFTVLPLCRENSTSYLHCLRGSLGHFFLSCPKVKEAKDKGQSEDTEGNLEMENLNGERGLSLKCYLDDSLHKKGSVFSFSLRITSRAHCDKKISLMLPDLV